MSTFGAWCVASVKGAVGVGWRNTITEDQPLISKCRVLSCSVFYMLISLFICIVLSKVHLLVVSFIHASQSQQMSELELLLCFIALDLKAASPSKTFGAVV